MLLLESSRQKNIKDVDEYNILGHLSRWISSEVSGAFPSFLSVLTGNKCIDFEYGWPKKHIEDIETVEDAKNTFFALENFDIKKLTFSLILEKRKSSNLYHYNSIRPIHDKYYLYPHYDGERFYRCGPYNSSPSHYNWTYVLWGAVRQCCIDEILFEIKHSKNKLFKRISDPLVKRIKNIRTKKDLLPNHTDEEISAGLLFYECLQKQIKEEFLTLNEIQRIFGVPQDEINHLVKKKLIPHRIIGNHPVFYKNELLDWIEHSQGVRLSDIKEYMEIKESIKMLRKISKDAKSNVTYVLGKHIVSCNVFSRKILNGLVSSGKIPFRKIANQFLFPSNEFLEFIEKYYPKKITKAKTAINRTKRGSL